MGKRKARVMENAPLDGTPVRLLTPDGPVIASWWTSRRSVETYGPGNYRSGWFRVDDDTIEIDDPEGWQAV